MRIFIFIIYCPVQVNLNYGKSWVNRKIPHWVDRVSCVQRDWFSHDFPYVPLGGWWWQLQTRPTCSSMYVGYTHKGAVIMIFGHHPLFIPENPGKPKQLWKPGILRKTRKTPENPENSGKPRILRKTLENPKYSGKPEILRKTPENPEYSGKPEILRKTRNTPENSGKPGRPQVV